MHDVHLCFTLVSKVHYLNRMIVYIHIVGLRVDHPNTVLFPLIDHLLISSSCCSPIHVNWLTKSSAKMLFNQGDDNLLPRIRS